MDFVWAALFCGRRLRALTVIDAFAREALTIDVDQDIKGEQVVAARARITSARDALKPSRSMMVRFHLDCAQPAGR
ncbi:MAG: hypothetical protein EKK50_03905 [Sphingomonadaceae bacterium]|nr:MAG: hypothetical protein EKK50_03905 [Sphingomonadaceae bacterium]